MATVNITHRAPPIYIHILDHEAIFLEVEEMAVEIVATPLPPETFFDVKEMAVEICLQELLVFYEVEEMAVEIVATPLPPETFFDVKEMAIELCCVPV